VEGLKKERARGNKGESTSPKQLIDQCFPREETNGFSLAETGGKGALGEQKAGQCEHDVGKDGNLAKNKKERLHLLLQRKSPCSHVPWSEKTSLRFGSGPKRSSVALGRPKWGRAIPQGERVKSEKDLAMQFKWGANTGGLDTQ